MTEFILIFIGVFAIAYISLRLGEDNVKQDLVEVLCEELNDINVGDPDAYSKLMLIKRIEEEIL